MWQFHLIKQEEVIMKALRLSLSLIVIIFFIGFHNKKVEASLTQADHDMLIVYFLGIEEDLARYFGTKVMIKRRGQKGKVEIEFYSNEDLDRLLNLFKSD